MSTSRQVVPARRQRGAAMVETVLGLMVMITVVTVGVHLAEVGFLSMKVTEASASAMWDVTGYRQHDWPNDTSPANAAVQRATTDANQRYRDFDSRTRQDTGASLTMMFTQAQNMNVRCTLGGARMNYGPAYHTAGAYSDNGGMSCFAEADLTAVRLPMNFLEDANEGFFNAPNYTPTPMHICSMGRANGNSCPGRLVARLDDWGLTGSAETRISPVIPNAPGAALNQKYYRMMSSTYFRNGGGMGPFGTLMMFQVVQRMPNGWIPVGEMVPWLSFIGEPLFAQPLPSEGAFLWTTTPGGAPGVGVGGAFYVGAYLMRDDCFLGQDDC